MALTQIDGAVIHRASRTLVLLEVVKAGLDKDLKYLDKMLGFRRRADDHIRIEGSYHLT